MAKSIKSTPQHQSQNHELAQLRDYLESLQDCLFCIGTLEAGILEAPDDRRASFLGLASELRDFTSDPPESIHHPDSSVLHAKILACRDGILEIIDALEVLLSPDGFTLTEVQAEVYRTQIMKLYVTLKRWDTR